MKTILISLRRLPGWIKDNNRLHRNAEWQDVVDFVKKQRLWWRRTEKRNEVITSDDVIEQFPSSVPECFGPCDTFVFMAKLSSWNCTWIYFLSKQWSRCESVGSLDTGTSGQLFTMAVTSTNNVVCTSRVSLEDPILGCMYFTGSPVTINLLYAFLNVDYLKTQWARCVQVWHRDTWRGLRTAWVLLCYGQI